MADGGKYKGPRDERGDYFDDIMGDNSIPEIFDGPGMRDYENVSARATQKGPVIDMHCRVCSRGARIQIEWGELFIAAHTPKTGIMPAGWKRSDVNAALYPDLTCQCGGDCAPMITPDWAAQQVEAALQSGVLTEQALANDPQVQAVNAAVQQRQGRG